MRFVKKEDFAVVPGRRAIKPPHTVSPVRRPPVVDNFIEIARHESKANLLAFIVQALVVNLMSVAPYRGSGEHYDRD
ncbi:MAG: hypothetical protein WD294_02400 [Phycisphaeraceae bacterium]